MPLQAKFDHKPKRPGLKALTEDIKRELAEKQEKIKRELKLTEQKFKRLKINDKPIDARLRELKLREINLKDEARFIRNWFDKPLVTGAVSPSGKALARLMAGRLDPNQPGQVLELGPGTGPVTEALIERGFDESRLVLVEFSEDFAKLLKERFPRATIILGSAYEVPRLVPQHLTGPLCGIVSSLPLLTRPVSQRVSLFDACFDLAAPGAPIVQFTYGHSSPVPLEAIPHIAAQGSQRVWLNIPPARVWTYRRA